MNIGGGAITQPSSPSPSRAACSPLRQLAAWRSAGAGGAAGLADVTTDTLNEKNRAELLWTRAVGYYAAADPPQATAIWPLPTPALPAPEKSALAEEYRREGHAAIADLLDRRLTGRAQPGGDANDPNRHRHGRRNRR
jgi:hypothetical protein